MNKASRERASESGRAQPAREQVRAVEGQHLLGQVPAGGAVQLSHLALTSPAQAARMARQMQRRRGNVTVARAAIQGAPVVQAKLVVTQPGDRYEQEADSATAQLSYIGQDSVQRAALSPVGPGLAADAGVPVTPAVEAGIQAARGGGQPLPEGVRGQMEGALGADFSGVRLHTSPAAHALNEALQARAFTIGRDIFFRHGEYAPGSTAGKTLLAHELAHVVQQGEGVGILQRRPYEQLDNLQRAQVDAIAGSIYERKADAFEQKVAFVAGGRLEALNAIERLARTTGMPQAPGFMTSGSRMLELVTHLTLSPLAQGVPIGHITRWLNESVQQSHTISRKGPNERRPISEEHQLPPPPRTPGEAEILPTFTAGALRWDSPYATGLRRIRQRARRGPSEEAATIMHVANLTREAEAARRELRLALIAAYVPGTYTFFEIVEGAANGVPIQYPGARIYREIEPPLSASAIGLLYPDHFISPAFLIELAHFVYPDSLAEAQQASARMPADVVQLLLQMAPHLQRPRSIDPNLAAILPRALYDQLNDQQLGAVHSVLHQIRAGHPTNVPEVVAFLGHAPISIPAVQATFITHLILNTTDVDDPRLLHPIRLAARALFPEPEHHPSLVPGTAEQAQRAGYDAQRIAAVLGRYDRGIDVQIVSQQTQQLIAADPRGADAIRRYTSQSFTRLYTTLSTPWQPYTTGAGRVQIPLARHEHREASQHVLAATRALGRHDVGPPYQGVVFHGGPRAIPGSLESLRSRFRPGAIYSPLNFLSASKTVRDSFYVPGSNQVLLIIDDIATGKDVQLLSPVFWHQREVLFPPHARFVTTRVELDALNEHGTGDLVVYLREVAPSPASPRHLEAMARVSEYRRGRTLARAFIDTADFTPAEQAYLTEQALGPEHTAHIEGRPTGLVPPDELYGRGNIEAWRTAIAAQPVFIQELRERGISRPLIARAHQLLAMHDPQPNRLGVTRDQLSYDIPPWPGGPFTAEQLRALGEKGLSGAPSAAGPDRYDISYMPSAQVGSALDQYIHQYNTLLHNTSRMPNSTPAELSARQIAIVRHAGWAQQQLVAIHPFMNGNGRLSRYIMYMTLRIYPEIEQLPEEQRTPVLPNTASDLWTPYETWAEQLYRLIYLQHGAT